MSYTQIYSSFSWTLSQMCGCVVVVVALFFFHSVLSFEVRLLLLRLSHTPLKIAISDHFIPFAKMLHYQMKTKTYVSHFFCSFAFQILCSLGVNIWFLFWLELGLCAHAYCWCVFVRNISFYHSLVLLIFFSLSLLVFLSSPLFIISEFCGIVRFWFGRIFFILRFFFLCK